MQSTINTLKELIETELHSLRLKNPKVLTSVTATSVTFIIVWEAGDAKPHIKFKISKIQMRSYTFRDFVTIARAIREKVKLKNEKIIDLDSPIGV